MFFGFAFFVSGVTRPRSELFLTHKLKKAFSEGKLARLPILDKMILFNSRVLVAAWGDWTKSTKSFFEFNQISPSLVRQESDHVCSHLRPLINHSNWIVRKDRKWRQGNQILRRAKTHLPPNALWPLFSIIVKSVIEWVSEIWQNGINNRSWNLSIVFLFSDKIKF